MASASSGDATSRPSLQPEKVGVGPAVDPIVRLAIASAQWRSVANVVLVRPKSSVKQEPRPAVGLVSLSNSSTTNITSSNYPPACRKYRTSGMEG
jgi:hypothetical protein